MTKSCVSDGCETQPVFGVPGSKKASHCTRHKLEGMVDVKNKTCVSDGCETRSVFGVPGSKKASHCARHKLEGMVDVRHKTCISDGCSTIPVFGVPGSKKASHCTRHKLEGMVNVKDKTCVSDGCLTIPAFGVPFSKKSSHCTMHKLEGMVNVVSKTCVSDGCSTIPAFGVRGSKKSSHCTMHKLEGMVDVCHKTCVSDGCSTIPAFGVPGSKKSSHCTRHKLEGMVDVKSKTCVSAWCSTIPGKRYKGYCVRCFVHLFPDTPVSRDYKTKERTVVDFVVNEFPRVTWICDRRVSNGCSARRPDLLCDLGDQVLMVEIDENQHGSYDCSCENKRLMELSRDVDHRPLVVIRFNPDEYVDRDGVKHPSCFGVDGRGMVRVGKRKRDEWDDRLACLRSTVLYWIEARTDKTVEVVSLFFTLS